MQVIIDTIDKHLLIQQEFFNYCSLLTKRGILISVDQNFKQTHSNNINSLRIWVSKKTFDKLFKGKMIIESETSYEAIVGKIDENGFKERDENEIDYTLFEDFNSIKVSINTLNFVSKEPKAVILSE